MDLKQLGVVERIAQRIDTMPGAMARVGRYISLYPERVINQSIVELGEATRTGQATIIRLCRLLGCAGFRDIKLALMNDIATERSFLSGRGAATNNIDIDLLNSSMQKSIHQTSQFLAALDLSIIARDIASGSRLVVFGGGASGICASLLSFRFIRLGVPAFALDDSRLAYLSAQGLPENGVAVAISLSGITGETIEFMKAAQAAGARTIAITARPASPIVAFADHVLPFHLSGPWPLEGSAHFVAPFVIVLEALANALLDIRKTKIP